MKQTSCYWSCTRRVQRSPRWTQKQSVVLGLRSPTHSNSENPFNFSMHIWIDEMGQSRCCECCTHFALWYLQATLPLNTKTWLLQAISYMYFNWVEQIPFTNYCVRVKTLNDAKNCYLCIQLTLDGQSYYDQTKWPSVSSSDLRGE